MRQIFSGQSRSSFNTECVRSNCFFCAVCKLEILSWNTITLCLSFVKSKMGVSCPWTFAKNPTSIDIIAVCHLNRAQATLIEKSRQNLTGNNCFYFLNSVITNLLLKIKNENSIFYESYNFETLFTPSFRYVLPIIYSLKKLASITYTKNY